MPIGHKKILFSGWKIFSSIFFWSNWCYYLQWNNDFHCYANGFDEQNKVKVGTGFYWKYGRSFVFEICIKYRWLWFCQYDCNLLFVYFLLFSLHSLRRGRRWSFLLIKESSFVLFSKYYLRENTLFSLN